MSKKSEYLSKYKEIEIIGRGNFGSATLVKHISTDKIFVAKKVLLGNLSQKEVEGAHLELKLLKQLNHPNIVSYYENFVEDGTMIIIMEYCEEGDLAFFIKHRAQKNEYMEEKLVLNWFLQLLLSLEYIHRQKILHRDIKSSNIFLTSNGTVKLGDFGISKVLDNTNDAAVTVVGTPYYMRNYWLSPEVCENKPYTYKSDVWALGCVLYEMCTLKHAFSADNLLGLVFKIVREKNEPIPKFYSPELSQLVQHLLIKNDKARPDIKEIFVIPFIQVTIEEFVRQDTQGLKTMIRIPIKKTHLHNEIKRQQNQNNNNMGTIKDSHVQANRQEFDCTTVSMVSDDPYVYNNNTKKQQQQPKQQQYQQQTYDPYENLTPQQRMKRKKEEERQRNEEKLREAAKQNRLSIEQSKYRKQYELQGNISRKVDKNPQYSSIQGNQGYAMPVVAQSPSNNINNNFASNQNIVGNNAYNNMQQGQYSNPAMNNQMNINGTNYSQISNFSAFGTVINNKNCGTKPYDNNSLEGTNESLSFSFTNESNIPQQLNQDPSKQLINSPYNQYARSLNSNNNSAYGQYTIKTEYSNDYSMQQPTIRPTIQDDRPLPALINKNKNLSDIGYGLTDKFNDYDNDDDEYLDDFEEYNSEDDDNSRITVKASQQELSDVINLYKAKLNQTETKKIGGNLEEIKETIFENSQESTKSSNSMSTSQTKGKTDGIISSKQAKINAAKDNAIAKLGKKNYDIVYEFLKKERDLDRPDDYIRHKIFEMVGRDKKIYDACFMIDQILFLESFS